MVTSYGTIAACCCGFHGSRCCGAEGGAFGDAADGPFVAVWCCWCVQKHKGANTKQYNMPAMPFITPPVFIMNFNWELDATLQFTAPQVGPASQKHMMHCACTSCDVLLHVFH